MGGIAAMNGMRRDRIRGNASASSRCTDVSGVITR